MTCGSTGLKARGFGEADDPGTIDSRAKQRPGDGLLSANEASE
jgi:hypothetical protein